MFGNLSNSSSPSLDPILSLRRKVVLCPGERAKLAVITMAAPSRDQIIRVVDKYRDLEAADRAFELAWTHSQLGLRYLRIQNEDVQRFQELASHMIYPNAGLRPGAERLRRNVLGQPGLWAFGISGDLPICAVIIGDPIDLGAVREVLQAHTFWHERGLISDVVILNSEPGSYDQPLQQRLLKLIQIHSVHTGLDRRGGVFLRNIDQLSAEDVTLILSAAHVVLFASRGTLARQLSSQSQASAYPPAFRPLSTIPEVQSVPLPIPELKYFNGAGGFAEDGREYVIYHDGDSQTPAPWINVLANPRFGALADETGQGFSWFGNSQMNRLTLWHNDPVIPDLSAGIYVRDEESGRYWTPAASPIRGFEPYRICHGQGYTRIEHNSHGLEHELVTFVPADNCSGDPVRIQRLKIKNSLSHRRKLSVTFYTDWVMGRDREDTQLHLISSWDPVSQALIARNAYNPDFSKNISFAVAFPAATSCTADRTEFLGRNGSADAPAALGRRSLSGRTGAGLDPCAALQVKVDLNAGQEREIDFILGQAETINEVRSLIEKYSRLEAVAASFAKTKAFWDALLGTIKVNTPDKATDFLLNRWLLYQTLSCRIWARSALYQSGGAFGFRDQLQDIMAVVYSRPDLARAHILRSAGRQFIEGDVQHWWHPQSGAGVRTRCSDDLLWLPYVTAHYVKVTGDRQILEEHVPFLEGQPLRDNELEAYAVPSICMSDGTLFEHCRRAIDKGFALGERGLPLIKLLHVLAGAFVEALFAHRTTEVICLAVVLADEALCPGFGRINLHFANQVYGAFLFSFFIFHEGYDSKSRKRAAGRNIASDRLDIRLPVSALPAQNVEAKSLRLPLATLLQFLAHVGGYGLADFLDSLPRVSLEFGEPLREVPDVELVGAQIRRQLVPIYGR
jgi:cyclic beta-1,2-glucan synthetase